MPHPARAQWPQASPRSDCLSCAGQILLRFERKKQDLDALLGISASSRPIPQVMQHAGRSTVVGAVRLLARWEPGVQQLSAFCRVDSASLREDAPRFPRGAALLSRKDRVLPTWCKR